MRIDFWPWAFALVASASVAALVMISPVVTLILIVVGLLILVVIKSPDTLILLAFAMATVSLPEFIPTSFSTSSVTVKAYEPLLAFSVLYAVFRYKGKIPLPVWGFAALILVWTAVGLIGEHEPSKIIYDVRNLVMLLAACVIACRVAGTDVTRRLLPWVKGVLWLSAALTLLSSAGLVTLAGRSEEAALPVSGSSAGDTALRLLTPATHLALAVLCVMAVLIVTRRCRMSDAIGFIVPAALLVFISFSRNSILGIGIALIFALLASRNFRSGVKTAGYSLAVMASFAILTIASPALAQLPGGAWLNKQVGGFSERVLGGLTSDTLAVDNSAQFRFLMENNLILPKINDAPFFGHGFGFAYKLPTGPLGSFTAEFAPYYAHNFYLWILVKAGILGLLLFLCFSLLPCIKLLNTRDHLGLAFGGATCALLAISFVAPMPIGSPTSLIFGALIGTCYAYSRKNYSETTRWKRAIPPDPAASRPGMLVVRSPHSP